MTNLSCAIHGMMSNHSHMSKDKKNHVKIRKRWQILVDASHLCIPEDWYYNRMILQLIDNLDLNSPFDATVAACAVTAFWGQCRLGELLPSHASDLPSSPFPTCTDFKCSIRNPLSCLLHLPRTKTHQHSQDVVLVDQYDPINPIPLLKNHIRVNSIPKSDFLFAYTTTSTSTCSFLTKPLFLQRCNSIWHHLGYPTLPATVSAMEGQPNSWLLAHPLMSSRQWVDGLQNLSCAIGVHSTILPRNTFGT